MEQRCVLSATQIVADINPDGKHVQYDSYFDDGVEVDGRFYFWGYLDGAWENGVELWEYDPEGEGGRGAAKQVAVLENSESEEVIELEALNGNVYFHTRHVDDDSGQRKLWRFDPANDDPTTAATLAGEFYTNFDTFSVDLTAWNGKLYFTAPGSDQGEALWRYDPQSQAEPFQVVAEIYASDTTGSLLELTPLGDQLYFISDSSNHGSELWRYDTGEASQVLEVNEDYAFLNDLFAFNSSLYFAASTSSNGNELWQYTPETAQNSASLELVADIMEGQGSSWPIGFTELDGKLYFGAYTDAAGGEVWEHDPSAGTTRQITDIYAGAQSSLSWPALTALEGNLYFAANDGQLGEELWKFDPAGNGGTGEVSMVADIGPGVADSYPTGMVAVGRKLVFNASSDISYHMWQHDPAANEGIGSTTAVLATDYGAGSNSYEYTALDGSLYFLAKSDSANHQLWRHDPDPSGNGQGTTTRIEQAALANETAYVYEIIAAGDSLYLRGEVDNSKILWRYQPDNSNGIMHAIDGDFTAVLDMIERNGLLYFLADEGNGEYGLWRVDPSEDNGLATSERLAGIPNVRELYAPKALTGVGEKFYFVAEDTSNGEQLWEYDPNASEGAELQVLSSHLGFVSSLWALDGNLYFAAHDATVGRELWKFSLDSPAGLNNPQVVLDIVEGSQSSSPDIQAVIDGKLYFNAHDASGDRKMWEYSPDAEEVSLAAIHDFDGASPKEVVISQGTIYFLTERDGMATLFNFTPGQTANPRIAMGVVQLPLARDSIFSYLGEMELIDERIYLAAWDPQHGLEPWSVDLRESLETMDATLEFTFTKNSSDVGIIENTRSGQQPTFHEWEDAPGQVWLTFNEELPTEPFDLTFQFLSDSDWFDSPQLHSHLGDSATWQTESIFTFVTFKDIDLSGLTEIQVGDRVLVATLEFPRNVENPAGISIAQEGAYPEPDSDHGVQVMMGKVSGSHIQQEPEVPGQFTPVIYDLDDDGRIGLSDFTEFVRRFGQSVGMETPEAYQGDFDGNGNVGLSDFSLFVQHFGANKEDGRDSMNMPYFDNAASQTTNTRPRLSTSAVTLEEEPFSDPISLDFSEPYTPVMPEDEPPRDDTARISRDSSASHPRSMAVSLDPRLLDAALATEYQTGPDELTEWEHHWDEWGDLLL